MKATRMLIIRQHFLTVILCLQVKYKNQALKKIAPKPSPLHMSAAVALSELAGNPSQT